WSPFRRKPRQPKKRLSIWAPCQLQDRPGRSCAGRCRELMPGIAYSCMVVGGGMELKALAAVVDSLVQASQAAHHVVQDVSIKDSVLVKQLERPQSWFIALIDNHLFGLVWPLLTSTGAFFSGKWYERWKEGSEHKNQKWTAARLSLRYLEAGATNI